MNSKMLTPFDAFDALFHGGTRSGCARTDSGEAFLRPRTDIRENEQSYVIETDLPGVIKDDLQVEIENGELKISARRDRSEESDLKALHVERYSSAKYSRSFTLGEDVDPDKIDASFKNGVLTLTLPKQAKALPRRITVS